MQSLPMVYWVANNNTTDHRWGINLTFADHWHLSHCYWVPHRWMIYTVKCQCIVQFPFTPSNLVACLCSSPDVSNGSVHLDFLLVFCSSTYNPETTPQWTIRWCYAHRLLYTMCSLDSPDDPSSFQSSDPIHVPLSFQLGSWLFSSSMLWLSMTQIYC